MNTAVDEKSQIIQRLLNSKDQLFALGVESLGIFGSFARKQQTASSDVDLLVEFAPGKHNFDNFMELSFLVEELLGRRVDLVTVESLSPYIRPTILQEVERVPLAA